MRTFVGFLAAMLIVIALAGLGSAAWIVVTAAERVDDRDAAAQIVAMLGIAAVPLAIGTVALGFSALVLAVGLRTAREAPAVVLPPRTNDDPAFARMRG